jgi:hypothetical protein
MRHASDEEVLAIVEEILERRSELFDRLRDS